MNSRIGGIVLSLVIAGLVGWFLMTHERQSQEFYVGFSGEARYNPFLAAERLLNELDIEADSRETFRPSEWLPPGTDTLIVYANPVLTESVELASLYDWVSIEGGHLVLLPPRDDDVNVDVLFTEFGLTMLPTNDLAEDGVDEEAGGGDTGDEEVADADTEAPEDEVDYEVDLSATPYRLEAFDADASASLYDDLGNIALRRAEGNGYVTAVASEYYFNNYWLNEADHARLLLDVVAGYVVPGKVWFVYQMSFPPLWKVILDAAPYLLSTLALILVFWLWSRMPRFGPLVEAQPDTRRSIGEHVAAAGRFGWRYDGAAALIDDTVRATLHEAERRHPGLTRQPRAKQAETLAHMTGLDAQDILDALSGGEMPARDFTESIQLLQTLRKKL